MSLGVQEFGFVADLVRREAAIVLTTGKEYLVETRLAPLARAAGAPGVADFVRGVQASGTARQRRAIVEALTTNETSWFRDAGVFEALRTEILPGLLESRGPVRPVRVWSAAASTGQEAYSVAMLMGEIAPGRRADILATDISQEVLDQARSGRYSQFAVNRGLPARFLAQHFRRCGLEWELDAELRRCVTFKLLNLAQPFPAIPPMDLVLMRNVLIYFDPATKRDVLRRVRRVLAPGGWLVLGTAETTSGIDDEFEIVRLQRTTAYRVRAN